MKVDTMRALDYWLGVPLCFVASLLLAPFQRRPGKTPRNVLFIELSEMGSAILVDPAMRKLRDESRCSLFFAIFAQNKPSLDLLGTVPDGNIYTIRDDTLLHLLIDALRFPFWARRNGIDTVIDLELFSRFTALMCGFAGASNRVGFHSYHNEGLYRGSMMSHRVLYNPHRHIAKNFIALVNAVLSDRSELPYSKTVVPDSEIRLAKAVPDPGQLSEFLSLVGDLVGQPIEPERHKIVLVNANASELLIQRRWMPENYASLIRTIIAEHHDALVLLTGSPGEFDEMERLRQQVDQSRCWNTAGRFAFHELPLLYSISQLMVTNDSGPAHFAAVTELRVFVLFGPETPELYGSLGNSVPIYRNLACSPCVSAFNHRKTPCRDNVCLQLIKPHEVYETIKPDLQADPVLPSRLAASGALNAGTGSSGAQT
ncbi:MAG TPA: glycosyltransferase family 9 protein [Arenicellales bacterium]|nr:glycosyltransferase family 9 protein [Arenicellales bacterium]